MPDRLEPLEYETPPRQKTFVQGGRSPGTLRRLFFALGMAITFAALGYAIGKHEPELVSFWMFVGGGLIGLTLPLRI
jgi:hypothetical protein